MLPGNENTQTIALSQVLAQRRVQTVSVQKPPQNMQQQITIDGNAGTSQPQVSTTQQNITQPQNSPQLVRFKLHKLKMY